MAATRNRLLYLREHEHEHRQQHERNAQLRLRIRSSASVIRPQVRIQEQQHTTKITASTQRVNSF